MTASASDLPELVFRERQADSYEPVFEAMKVFSRARTEATPDEVWVVDHQPVFTQGQAGKPQHLLTEPDGGNGQVLLAGIPLVQTDRGGQVTYHGPGQLVVYPLLQLSRYGLQPRSLVSLLEATVVSTLADFGIAAAAKREAPGVYVSADGSKIASLGLRITRGYCYHGLAINVDMDMKPFRLINPCGYAGLAMSQIRDYCKDTALLPADRPAALQAVATRWRLHFLALLADTHKESVA
ncbi:MAG: octanoyltransferase [unclassified Hahellaceae]|nr:octanoyltransferase [Hahellaceae bacterium]|tara:strand:+ start:64926 stop:65642 length:717 start_codon:yes stop_codon:yes gene_type:complete